MYSNGLLIFFLMFVFSGGCKMWDWSDEPVKSRQFNPALCRLWIATWNHSSDGVVSYIHKHIQTESLCH